MGWQTELAQAIAALDQRELQTKFQFHNEFLVVEQFLPPDFGIYHRSWHEQVESFCVEYERCDQLRWCHRQSPI